MKIYYSFPLQKIEENAKKYNSVITFLKDQKHSLTREWLDDALNNIKLNRAQPSRSEMYLDVMKAIRDATICIFDVTVKSMSVAQQIVYALERRKPTLMLSDSTKGDAVDSLMITGSRSGYLYAFDYTNDEEMFFTISSFINNKDITDPPQRYNFFLEKGLADYVNWRSFVSDGAETKTDVISRAVQEAMLADTQYKEFLDLSEGKNRL